MDEPLLQVSRIQEIADIKHSFSLAQQFLRWSMSALSVALLFAAIKGFESGGVLTPIRVNAFNVVTTALQLLLSLGFFDAFKDLARVWRWRILRGFSWSDQEKYLIRQLARWTAVAQLAWRSYANRWLLLACCLWGAQTAVALISQQWSMQSGTNWDGTYLNPDLVHAADLSCFYHHHYDAREYTCDSSPEVVHGIAHAYGAYAFGSLTPGHDCMDYTTSDDILRSRKVPTYYCRRTPNQQEFAYRFLEYNPHDNQRTYPHLTNRFITASSGPCDEYSILRVEPGVGNYSHLTYYHYTDGNITSVQWLPQSISTLDGTVYIYRGFNVPENTTDYACGDRCITTWAYRTDTGRDDSRFYECPITVGEVQNSSMAEHQVPQNIARLAAASIGLQGGTADKENGWTQFQFFPLADAWDIHGKRSDEVGANMAEFALGSIATMATNNPPLDNITGLRPTLGSKLDVTWPSAIALLCCILGIHTALSALAFYGDWYNKTYLLDDNGLRGSVMG